MPRNTCQDWLRTRRTLLYSPYSCICQVQKVSRMGEGKAGQRRLKVTWARVSSTGKLRGKDGSVGLDHFSELSKFYFLIPCLFKFLSLPSFTSPLPSHPPHAATAPLPKLISYVTPSTCRPPLPPSQLRVNSGLQSRSSVRKHPRRSTLCEALEG